MNKKIISAVLVSLFILNVNCFADTDAEQEFSEYEEILSGTSVEIEANLSDLKSGEISYPVEGGNIYIDVSTGAVVRCDTSVKKVEIPESFEGINITGIGDSAFYGINMTSVKLSDKVKYIGNKAFMGCSELQNIDIPTGVESIGIGAFADCIKLENIYVDENNNNYCSESGVLYNKDKSVLLSFPGGNWGNSSSGEERIFVVPKSVSYIADMAFYGCYKLNKISSFYAEYIGESAFEKCYFLKEAVIESVDAISERAFKDCEFLEVVRLYPGVKHINDYAFSGCWRLTDVEIPYTVTRIGDHAFSSCSSIETLDLPDHLESIGELAFNSCIKLTGTWKTPTYFVIPYSVKSIGNSAFAHCISLTDAEIPYSLESIGYIPFNYCDKLSTVYCYKGTIADDAGLYPAKTQLEYIDDGLKYLEIPYSEENGTYYYNPLSGEITDFKEADPYSSSKFDLNIPETINGTNITAIGEGAFSGCKSIQKIILPESILSINDNAFENCESLTEIKIPQSVTFMGNDVFLNCSMLKTVYVYKNSYADNKAFYSDGVSVEYAADAIKGDLDGDNKATVADALIVARLAIGKVKNDELYSLCDYDNDGRVTVNDALILARYSLGKISKL